MQGKFRMLLFEIFDVFDINMNKILEKSEFDLFTQLSEDNSFEKNIGMSLTAFIKMFKAELISGSDGLNDVAVNMRNIGVDSKLQQTGMCPYQLHLLSHEKQPLKSQLFDVDADSAELLPFFFFDHGEELMEYDVSHDRLDYSLNWRLFRCKFFAVLVSRNV
ncbi:hypothetical protein PFISCL1PPCAC_7905, partial [Pristionchus fissidentatus]